MIKDLVRGTTHYSAGNGMVMLAGLISFPILTRLLSVEEYGALSLISAALVFAVGAAKAGMQHAIVRFYVDADSDGTLRRFYSSVLISMALLAVAGWGGWLAVVTIVPHGWATNPALQSALMIAGGLVFIRVVDSAFLNILRAREQSQLYNVVRVIKTYLSIGLFLTVLLYFRRDLNGYFGSLIAIELIMLLYIASRMSGTISFARTEYSGELVKKMIFFGLPMMGFELAGAVLSFGDRFVIESVMGTAAVGEYSASYNLSEYVQQATFRASWLASLPLILRMWKSEGDVATAEFVGRILSLYVLAAAPIVAGMALVGPAVVNILATDKFAAGTIIIPYVVAGMAFQGMAAYMAAGLYVNRASLHLMVIVSGSALLNIVLNLFLVPRYGLIGAAWATLVSCVILALWSLLSGRRRIRVDIALLPMLRYIGYSLIMYWAVSRIHFGNSTLTVAAQVAAGVVLYSLMVMILEKDIRRDVLAATGIDKSGNGRA